MDNFEDMVVLANRFSSLLRCDVDMVLSIMGELGENWKLQIILNVNDAECSFALKNFILDAMTAEEFDIALLVYITEKLLDKGFIRSVANLDKSSFVYRMD